MYSVHPSSLEHVHDSGSILQFQDDDTIADYRMYVRFYHGIKLSRFKPDILAPETHIDVLNAHIVFK